MTLSNEDFQLTLGDHVRALADLVDMPDPKNVMSVHISVEGLEIEYADRTVKSAMVTRTVKRHGHVKFRPLDE